MSSHDFVKLALQMATMLAFALIFGEIMRRFKQPSVVGEMFGGIVLVRRSSDGWRRRFTTGSSSHRPGATGIILAGVGLTNGVIDARIFVAIVVMALVTSLIAVPMMSRLLWSHQANTARSTAPAMGRARS